MQKCYMIIDFIDYRYIPTRLCNIFVTGSKINLYFVIVNLEIKSDEFKAAKYKTY